MSVIIIIFKYTVRTPTNYFKKTELENLNLPRSYIIFIDYLRYFVKYIIVFCLKVTKKLFM